MGTGAPIIRVNFDGLERLAGRMHIIGSALEDDHGIFGSGFDGIEHQGLRNEVDDFDARWSKKRHEICRNVDLVGTGLDMAVKTFSEAEAQLVMALGPRASGESVTA